MAITLRGNGTSTFSNSITSTTGNLTLGDGNLVVADGHGIDFSADANAPGSVSELLADYETGTWTPTLAAGGDSATFSNTRYIRIGNQVTVTARIGSVINPGAAALSVAGLPFSPSVGGATYEITGTCMFDSSNWTVGGATVPAWVVAYTSSTTNLIAFYRSFEAAGTGWTPVTGSNVTASGSAIFTITYLTTA